MGPANVEICSNCGRVLLRFEQAYLVGGKIVCAECDKLLRSEQVPQPAPSPEPLPEIRKGTEKNASLKKLIFVLVGVFGAILLLLRGFGFFGTKYQVETKIVKEKGSDFIELKVKITTRDPESLAVVFFGPRGTRTEDIEKSDLMDYEATVSFLLSSWEYNAYRSGTVDPRPGSYTLMIRRERDGKVVFKTNVNITSDMIKHMIKQAAEESKKVIERPIEIKVPTAEEEVTEK